MISGEKSELERFLRLGEKTCIRKALLDPDHQKSISSNVLDYTVKKATTTTQSRMDVLPFKSQGGVKLSSGISLP